MAAILFRRAMSDELSAAGDQFPKLINPTSFFPWNRLNFLREKGKHRSVDAIGLRQDVERLSEVPYLPRIDHRHLMIGSLQVCHDLPLITTSRLNDDQAGSRRR